MMNLISLSPETIAHISRGAVSFETNFVYSLHWMSNRYSAEVFYPNGYGVYFERRSSSGEDSGGWDLSLLSKGKICKEAEEFNAFYFDLSEEEIVNLCDQLYFLPAA